MELSNQSPVVRCEDHQFPGIGQAIYKDEPGTWMAVTKRVFESGQTQFEPRYFEIEPQGYTSFEKHAHEHFVVVLRGAGKVRLDDKEYDLTLHDMVHVKPHMPHQFLNPSTEPFGILCVVDKDRDRPVLLAGERTQ